MNWRRRKGVDAETLYERALSLVTGHEAVHAAEHVVGAAWISMLLDAEQEAQEAVHACAHMRANVGKTLRAAQQTSDAQQIVDAHRELATLEQALSESRSHYDGVRELVSRELDEWAAATRLRVLESMEDQDLLTKALHAKELAQAEKAAKAETKTTETNSVETNAEPE